MDKELKTALMYTLGAFITGGVSTVLYFISGFVFLISGNYSYTEYTAGILIIIWAICALVMACAVPIALVKEVNHERTN